MSKADYLKKYMEPAADKTKKRKKKKQKGNMAIIDNDVHWDDMKSDAQLQLEGEFAPTVANVVDDRPDKIRRKQDGWKTFGNDDKSPIRKKSSKKSAADTPPRRRRKSPESPVRARVNSDSSPVRKRVDSESPPRRRNRRESSDESPKRKRIDSDSSPPRRRVDSDESPVRKRVNSDSDNSPPRRRADSDESPPRNRVDSDSSPPRRPKMMDGTKAGLNTREEFRTQKPKIGKNSNLAKLMEEGKNAETVYREKGTGKKRDFKAEEEMSEQERLQKEEELKHYKVWNKGKKQLDDRKNNIDSYMKEIEKPLARYKDDKDYNDMKKDEMHAEDPMYAYVASRIKTKTKSSRKKSSKPVYTGSATCPNRFAIKPGYRWDGVDRSTGYESRLFKHSNVIKNRAFDAWRANTDDF